MTQETPAKPRKKPSVTDQHGHTYELTGRVGEGGQGIVFRTNNPNVLVKVARKGSDEKVGLWVSRIQRLMRQPLEGLPIAHPVALIEHPQPGYVMEMMDGLMPMSTLMQTASDALVAGGDVTGYIETGGLRRRLRILAKLARILAQLHGRGLAYGDLSPANVFVSRSLEYSEVWLIDADNIENVSRDGTQGIFTPDYGAPEIRRGESGINTLTDSWSFAVIAFRLLTSAHPLKGDRILESDPELEETAMRGELPWVDHATDRSNVLSGGLPREFVLNKSLRGLFETCFNAGLNEPGKRPSLAKWAEVFDTSSRRCLDCESCGSSFFYNPKFVCQFCDHVQEGCSVLVLQKYVYFPPDLLREGLDEDIPESLIRKECWTPTEEAELLASTPIELKRLPPDAALFGEASVLCGLELTPEGLFIEPSQSVPVAIQRATDQKVIHVKRRQRLPAKTRSDAYAWLHLGELGEVHDVWRFKW